MSVSLFAAFVIALFSWLVIYFAVGSAVRYHKGLRRCPDVLPNYRFWKYVVGVVRHGFLVLISCGKYKSRNMPTNSVLPSRPTRDQGFEQLPDQFEDFDDEPTEAAPSVTVRY